MPCSSILDLSRCLPIPGSAYEQAILDGAIAAGDPKITLLDCPWNYAGNDRHIKACRVAWRVAFRCQREQGKISLLQENRRAA